MNDELHDASLEPTSLAEPAPTDGELSSEAMTEEQLVEAKQYGHISLLCDLADKALDVAYLAVVALLLAAPLDVFLAESVGNATARLAMIFVITTLGHVVVSFPLSFYSGYSLEHRYALSHQTLGKWFAQYAKRNALGLTFGLVLVLGLYGVIWTTGPWWWLAAAAAFFVVTVAAGQLLPVLVLPLFYKIERLDNAELNQRMERLAAGTGLSIQGVYRMGLSDETAKANAMLTGLGRTRRVLMGDTLLDQFTPDEIEVIFAHEIGHHVFRHIYKMIVTGALYSVVGFWICNRVVALWVEAQQGPVDPSQWPPSTLPLLMLVLTCFSLLLEPIQNVISRRFERQCDRYALQRTGLKQAYGSAFRKLARMNKDDPSPHPVEVFLFHSHPPIAERLQAGEL